MIILGIETSCDETAAAVLRQKGGNFDILSNVVSSQVKLHSKWGGVVPNLAAREHLKNIVPVIKKTLAEAKISPKELDLIAVTNGPGLIPALLIGTSTAKTLSYLWKKPLIGIHHIEGHIYANFIDSPHPTLFLQRRGTNREVNKIKFPILCLVVSGGHTQLVYMKNHLSYKIVGQTLDDAAGEAFDKVARILGLGYPGGPDIAKHALQGKAGISNITLPRPMMNSKDFNFSFSGLKTAVLYLVKKNKERLKNKNFIAEICHEFQQAVIDVLVSKTLSAAKVYNPQAVFLAGGVSANQELRKQLKIAAKKELPDTQCHIPDIPYSLDNAAMIATAAYFRWTENRPKKKFLKTIEDNWKNLNTDANLKLK